MSKKNRRKQRIARERARAIVQTERAAQERRTQERAEVEMKSESLAEIHTAAMASLKMVPVSYAPSKGKPQYKHNPQSQGGEPMSQTAKAVNQPAIKGNQPTEANKPAETKVASQTIMTIPLDDLYIEEYQRRTVGPRAKKIAENFNEAKLGLLIASDRDGIFRLLDGAHRATALRILNYTHARCIVLHGLTYEDEARYFASQRDNTSALTQYNLFKACIEAKDPMCLEIRDIVRKHNFEIRSSGRGANTISAIHALKTVACEYGCEVLDITLRLIRETWDGIKQATNREYIVGVAEFVKRFGDPGFAANMRNKSINAIWQEYMTNTSYHSRGSGDPSMRRAFCRAILTQYNKGLRAHKRLEMEERA